MKLPPFDDAALIAASNLANLLLQSHEDAPEEDRMEAGTCFDAAFAELRRREVAWQRNLDLLCQHCGTKLWDEQGKPRSKEIQFDRAHYACHSPECPP